MILKLPHNERMPVKTRNLIMSFCFYELSQVRQLIQASVADAWARRYSLAFTAVGRKMQGCSLAILGWVPMLVVHEEHLWSFWSIYLLQRLLCHGTRVGFMNWCSKLWDWDVLWLLPWQTTVTGKTYMGIRRCVCQTSPCSIATIWMWLEVL